MEFVKVVDKKTFDYEGKVYDLEVAIDHTYKINDYTVHNSAGGSLTLFCLGITTLDPLKYDLIFERFLSDSRAPNVGYSYFKEF